MKIQEFDYKYVPLSEPVPIKDQVWRDGVLPLVTTRTMTYMHENYIRDCIEGILMQKTTFPVRVTIHDDASTDKTAVIIKEYESKYPKIIKAVYQSKNTYSLTDKNERRKLRKSFFELQVGKYSAMCEGDDYWTDPLKLQKQVSFLEKNIDYVLTFHDCLIIDENGELLQQSKLNDNHKRDYTREDLILGNLVPTLSVVYRRKYNKYIPQKPSHVINGDTYLFSNLGRFGKGHYHKDISPAVYRAHCGGIWSSKSLLEKNTHKLNNCIALLDAHFPENQSLLKQKLFDLSCKRLVLFPCKYDRFRYYSVVISRIPFNKLLFKNLLRIHYYLFFKKISS